LTSVSDSELLLLFFAMLVEIIIFLTALALLTRASPESDPYAIHEKRSSAPIGWEKRERLNNNTILPVSIALAQENLEKGYDWLMDVSHPSSSKYGQHWNISDVSSAFAPRFVVVLVS
jgi:tripeptidyl-peptidase I